MYVESDSEDSGWLGIRSRRKYLWHRGRCNSARPSLSMAVCLVFSFMLFVSACSKRQECERLSLAILEIDMSPTTEIIEQAKTSVQLAGAVKLLEHVDASIEKLGSDFNVESVEQLSIAARNALDNLRAATLEFKAATEESAPVFAEGALFLASKDAQLEKNRSDVLSGILRMKLGYDRGMEIANRMSTATGDKHWELLAREAERLEAIAVHGPSRLAGQRLAVEALRNSATLFSKQHELSVRLKVFMKRADISLNRIEDARGKLESVKAASATVCM